MAKTPADDFSKHRELLNPMNPEQKYLRRSLWPPLLKTVSHNVKNFAGVKLFEIGRVYTEKEQTVLAAALAIKDEPDAFRAIKGVVETIFYRLLSLKPADVDWQADGGRVKILVNKQNVG